MLRKYFKMLFLSALLAGCFSANLYASDIKLDFELTEDNRVVSYTFREGYAALLDNDCQRVFDLFEENTYGEVLIDPDLMALGSHLYEKGICFPKDEEKASSIMGDQANNWLMLRVRAGYLYEFGIGVEQDAEKAMENYLFFCSLILNRMIKSSLRVTL